jgi:competence protein ComEA
MFRHLIATVFAALALNAFAAVDVNQASQAELETVKGIGPGLSSKILDARKASSFKDWTDFVERVSGIGPGNANRFSQAGLTVAGKTYVAAAGDTAKPTAKADKADKAERKGSRKAAEPKPQ